MTPLVPIGYVVARICLAGASLTLLAMGSDTVTCHPSASTACPAQSGDTVPLVTAEAICADTRRGKARKASFESMAAAFLPGVHPLGLSSDGEPHDGHRYPHAALHRTR